MNKEKRNALLFIFAPVMICIGIIIITIMTSMLSLAIGPETILASILVKIYSVFCIVAQCIGVFCSVMGIKKAFQLKIIWLEVLGIIGLILNILFIGLAYLFLYVVVPSV